MNPAILHMNMITINKKSPGSFDPGENYVVVIAN
jgi:hypothetical protein